MIEMNKIRNEMERFFQKTNMVSTYKPMFLKALLDLGDFKENEGSQWVKDDSGNALTRPHSIMPLAEPLRRSNSTC